MENDDKTKSRLIDQVQKVTRDVSGSETTEPLQKQADEVLQQYKRAVEGSMDIMAAVDKDYTYLFANKAYLERHKLNEEQVIGRHFGEVVGEQYFENDLKPYMDKCLNGEMVHFETVYSYPEKGKCFMETWCYPLRDDDGEIKGVVGLARDITDRKRLEEKLRRNEERYRSFVAQSHEGVWRVELDAPCPTDIPPAEQVELVRKNRIAECNDAMARMYGFESAEKLIGHSLSEFISEEDETEIVGIFVNAGYRFTGVETEEVDQYGNKRYFVNNCFGIVVDNLLVGFWGTQRDVTRRRRAAATLLRSERLLRQVIDTNPAVIFVKDCDSRVLLANKTMAGFYNLSVDDVTDRFQTDLERQYGIDQKEIDKRLADDKKIIDTGNPIHLVESGTDAQNRLHWFQTGKYRIDIGQDRYGILVIAEDITERKQAEEEKASLEHQLRRSQKMETIGTLAGGVAHDFNNILTPIIGYADMALSGLPSSNPLRKDLEHILTGATRAKDLVEQILLFARQKEKERNPLKMHLIATEAIKLLRPSIPTTIEIRSRIDTSCDKILADASQMHQVIINLCTNAYQAMEEKGGTLTIELKQVEVDAATVKMNSNLDEDEYVRLTVSDTGTGMDDATLDRVFEPFFTTKARHKGSGMGLSVVHGIVRRHHGDIVVFSEEGKGSTFHVYLPIMKVERESDKKETQAIQGGGESILVVDDEEAIVDVMKRMLERIGYKVVACNSSIEALKTIRQQPDKYDLVISDLTMPIMPGLDLSKQIREIRSELPIIIMTGYGDSVTDDVQKHYGIQRVIGKPIMLRELAPAIRKAMGK